MRVWFLKETKTIDVNDGLGANITIGSRQEKIYRITPRENNDVNSCWLPDSHRLNFKYLTSEERLAPARGEGRARRVAASPRARRGATARRSGGRLALIASARFTNEELFLARRLIATLGITLFDVVPRQGEPDGIMIVADRNPNTAGAKLWASPVSPRLAPEIVAG